MKDLTRLLIIFFLMVSCHQTDKTTKSKDTKGINIKFLAQEWISTEQISDGVKKEIENVFYLNLKPDSTFNSFYKPDNSKKGFWRLNIDTTFTLYMKATDTFKILELTDSTLVVKVCYSSPETIFRFKRN